MYHKYFSADLAFNLLVLSYDGYVFEFDTSSKFEEAYKELSKEGISGIVCDHGYIDLLNFLYCDINIVL